jgi:hypothetical protein
MVAAGTPSVWRLAKVLLLLLLQSKIGLVLLHCCCW